MKLKNVLLVVDPQNVFISGSLAVKDADKFVKELVEYVKGEKKEEYDLCVITLDYHPETHCSFKENGGEWPVHCVEKTNGAEVPTEILNAIKDAGIPVVMLEKGTNEDTEEYSIFKNERSAKVLKKVLDNTEHVAVCGIAYDYCVKETLKDSVKQGYKDKLIVLSSLCPSIGDGKDVEEWLDDEGIPMIY